MSEPVYDLLVARLWRTYEWDHGYGTLDRRRFEKYPPVRKFESEMDRVELVESKEESLAWHFGRVHHFMTRIERGIKIAPVSVEGICHVGMKYASPVLSDGHHRLIAHVALKRWTIRATYGGWEELLDYLTGKSRRRAPRPYA